MNQDRLRLRRSWGPCDSSLMTVSASCHTATRPTATRPNGNVGCYGFIYYGKLQAKLKRKLMNLIVDPIVLDELA
jgi:hypothetical protein